MKEKTQKRYFILTYARDSFIITKTSGILNKLATSHMGPYEVVQHNNNESILIDKAQTYIANLNISDKPSATLVL